MCIKLHLAPKEIKIARIIACLRLTRVAMPFFAQPHVLPKPLVLAVDQVKIKDRGWKENVENWTQKEKAIIRHKMEKFEVRPGSGGGAVRG